MNAVTLRLIIAGSFGIISLVGGIIINICGSESPDWLAYMVIASASYIFGHVQANGVSGRKHG